MYGVRFINMRVIFSTNNNGKLKEIREILQDKEILSLSDLGIEINPQETGKTYEENAYIKAIACKEEMIKQNIFYKDDVIIADDSGLSVECLDGAPGIYSARFGNFGDDSKRKCAYLLDLMKNVSKENRKAKFICVLCVIIDDDIKYFKGEMEGEIGFSQKGVSGFGYDPVFIPKSYNKSVAELPDDEKNKISHRAKALQLFASTFLLTEI